MSTPLYKVVKEMDLTKRALGYGMKSIEVDGNDVIACYEATVEARKHAVENGPVLMVMHTYRTSGHSKSDGNLYRSKEEIAEWKERCPIQRMKAFALKNKIFTEAEIDAMEAKTTDILDKAVEFGKAAPEPDVANVLDNVFAD